MSREIPTPSPEELRAAEVQDWMNHVEADLKTAKHLMDGAFYPIPLEIICYHSEQAAEKAVKAVIVYFGSRGGIPKQHDIGFLMQQISKIVKAETGKIVTEEMLTYAINLTRFGVEPRYPNEMAIDERIAKEAIKQAEAIVQWAKDVISSELLTSKTDEKE